MTVMEMPSAALNVSQLRWSRLRNLVLIAIGLAVTLTISVYLISGGVVLLKASGMVIGPDLLSLALHAYPVTGSRVAAPERQASTPVPIHGRLPARRA